MVHAVEQNSLFVVGMVVHCFECNMTVGHLKNLETFLDIVVAEPGKHQSKLVIHMALSLSVVQSMH